MLVLLPMLAFAGWRQVSTVAALQDLQVVDAGVVLSSSLTGLTVWQISDAGVATLATLPGSFVGGGFFGGGCLIGLTAGGLVTSSSAGCGGGTALGAGSWSRFRLISDAPYGVALVTNASADTMWSGPGAAAGWAARGFPVAGSGTRTLQNARISGVDYAVVNGNNGIRVSVDGGDLPNAVIAATVWRDAAPFSMSGAPAILGATTTSLALLRDYRTPTAFTPTIPAGFSPRFVGMGIRTGMATTFSGELLGPIPNPVRPAETWVVRGRPPGTLLSERINCADDRYCVTATDAGVVWFWENEAPPTVGVVVPQLDAGQTLRLIADAGDGDGDPIFVTWASDAGSIVPVAGVEDGTAIDFTAPFGVCAPLLTLTVTDGLPTHDRTIQVPVTILERGSVQVTSTTQPIAGGAPVTLSAFIDGGCGVSASFTWSSPDGGTGSGPTFAWSPPATECNSDGGLVTITATANWSSGAPATTQVSHDLVVQPWGAPNPPLFASPVSQARGVPVDWFPSGSEHVCSTAGDFPGTALTWSWTVDGGAMVTELDGGLRIFATLCSTGTDQVIATAVRHLVDDPARVSAPGSLVVEIPPDLLALDANTGFGLTAEGDAGLLFGTFQIDAGCLPQRRARVTISATNAGTPSGTTSALAEDGTWNLSLAGGCSGGTYDVTAQLFEGGVFTGATAQQQVTLPFTAVQVGALSIDRVDVTCGAGASASVQLLPVANACGVAEVSWRETKGPPLVTSAGTGETLALQTDALDFSVVGQQLAFEFAADAGAGNVDVATRTLELGVQPFLEVDVKARPPLRREEEGASLEVTITNPTDCQVDGISLTLPFSGGSPLLETALLDGHKALARQTDEGVVIDAVTVPARGAAKLQLTARARLLSTPTVEPVASLNGYVVSTRVPLSAPATGCGCSELTSPAFFVLLTFVLRRRRRTPG